MDENRNFAPKKMVFDSNVKLPERRSVLFWFWSISPFVRVAIYVPPASCPATTRPQPSWGGSSCSKGPHTPRHNLAVGQLDKPRRAANKTVGYDCWQGWGSQMNGTTPKTMTPSSVGRQVSHTLGVCMAVAQPMAPLTKSNLQASKPTSRRSQRIQMAMLCCTWVNVQCHKNARLVGQQQNYQLVVLPRTCAPD